MKKIVVIIVSLLIGLSASVFAEEMVYLTAKELQQFDGKKNAKTYVAADGVIYDVTGVEAWKKGEHGKGKVGTDVSELIKKSPHGVKILEKRNKVGFLVKEIKAKELSKFNGQNGQPAYVAVSGLVYDVTGVEAWKKGEHGKGKVGTDISELIKKAPHGLNVLGKRTVVGKLVK